MSFPVERRAIPGVGVALDAIGRIAPAHEGDRRIVLRLQPGVEELERIQSE